MDVDRKWPAHGQNDAFDPSATWAAFHVAAARWFECRRVSSMGQGALLVFGAPHKHRLLLGREHGRTIPITDKALIIPSVSREEITEQEVSEPTAGRGCNSNVDRYRAQTTRVPLVADL